MAYDDDLPEYVGNDQTQRAEPKRKAAPPAPGISVSSAIYTPPAPGTAHPRHARLGPAQRLDAAEENLCAAKLELAASMAALRVADREETECLTTLIKAMPGPTYDQVNRERIANETAAKLARVQAGLPPVEVKTVTPRSPLDLAAQQRPRTAPHGANAPLRSHITRR